MALKWKLFGGSDHHGLTPAQELRRRVMLYVYLPLSVMYMEILIRLLCGYGFWQGLHVALLFSISVGLLTGAVALIIPKTVVSRIIAALSLGICGFLYVLEYFMFTAYRTFMNFDTIIIGAGQVMDEFKDVLASAIANGLPVIAAFILPLALFFPLTRKPVAFSGGEKKERLRLAARLGIALGAAIIAQAIILNTSSRDKAAYGAEYNFDISSRRLGVLMGIGLDLRYGVFGNPATDAFFVIAEASAPWTPPEAPAPPSAAALPESPTPSPVAMLSPVEESGQDPEIEQDSEPEPDPEPPPPIEYGYNITEIDLDSLIENESNSRIRAIHEYVASLSGSKQNPYTGIFEGKNLILITAESFTKEAVDPVMTPTLYRLVHNGFYFSDFYQPAWGGSTSSGEYSVMTGLAPVIGARSILHAARGNLCFTIGNMLQNLGYFSLAYHDGSYTYYERHTTHTYFGYSSFIAWGSGMEGKVQSQWPISDLEMMEFSIPQYIDQQPFSVYYMTVSGHCLYTRYGNAMADKNWDAFPEQYSQMSSYIHAYMACNLELEYALSYLVSALEEAGIADDTVIALAADHYPYGLEKSESWSTDKNYLPELFGYPVLTSADRDHNALIIWSGCLENEYKDMAVEISSPTFTLDIIPTLCNLFGLDFDSRLYAGRDIFSEAFALVFWLDRSWKTDLGYYDSMRDTFTPSTDEEIPDGYIDGVRSMVNNKINFSDSAIEYNYFNVLFYPDGTVR